ncbi:unnamed protein product [Bursaphelenchus xylophilus]|uniref:(pine wood nematode) hypothetical protein n=1 Tax=Bursaphelenchus xylophilus TaxID=6326 RepID=A0A1I7SSV7_BURXY|nr:unnamed protein product [Bursaphelenchus xylophilus]CAG9108865.1 unnamed protein product [Bursaphelenchus xylophilus]
MTEERPVVVNSLICFLNNYRDEANLERLLDYFSADAHRVAYQTLLDLIPDKLKLEEKPSLIRLFDLVNNNPKSPIFTASDLTVLPFNLNYERAPKMSNDLFNKIHQFRLIVQNAIDRNDDDMMFLPRQSQRQYPQSSSPKHDQYTDEEAMSSPSSEAAHSQSNHPASPSSSQFHVDALLGSQLVKKKSEGNRLDQAVRRITDRLGAKLEKPESRPTSTSSSQGAEDERMSNDNSSSTSNQNNRKCDLLNNNNNNTIPSNFMALLPLLRNPAMTAHLQFPVNAQNPVPLQLMKNWAINFHQQIQNQKQSEETESEDISVDTPDEADSKPGAQLSPISSESRTTDENQEKPFACMLPTCKKRFANKFLLKKHQFIHTGLRPHECPYCKKQFNRKDNLLRHKKTHINNSMSYSGRRRQNMLYGVSEETASRLNNFPFLSELMTQHVDSNDNIAMN